MPKAEGIIAQSQRILSQKAPLMRLLVIGDLMLDHWVWGSVSRISPEAPVPIVDVDRYTYTPGGAANVVTNLRALGTQVSLVGVVGRDDSARRLRVTLQRAGVDVGGLVTDPTRPTTLKTRIVAHSQQVVRADFESRQPLVESMQEKLLQSVSAQIGSCQAVLLSDYDKGLFLEPLFQALLNLAKAAGVAVVVGPKPANLTRFSGADLLTLNAKEAAQASGGCTRTLNGVLDAARRLRTQVEVASLVITRGEQGMSLFPKTGAPLHKPALASQVFDVSGAGDTVLSLLGLTLAAGASPQLGVELASHAAAVVVRKLGTATATPQEILDSLAQHHSQDTPIIKDKRR